MRQGLSMLATAVLVATVSVSAYAADVTGKWTAQVAGRDGQTREQTFTFKVDGETLTGTVKGNEITFTSSRDGGNAPPREFTAKRATS